MRQVEEDALEEQDERNPLVVTMNPPFALSLVFRPDTRECLRILGDFTTGQFWGSGQSECVLNPAVSVDDFRPADGIVRDAVDRTSNEVKCRDDDASGEEEGASETIVKTEDGVVDIGLVVQESDPNEPGKTAQ